MPNTYSNRWFETFLRTIDPERTAKETSFLMRQLPLEAHTTILEVCCGEGRHALALAEAGYYVTGIDRKRQVIAKARKKGIGTKATFYEHDMRRLHLLPKTYDAVLNLWQSFGFFDEETNLNALRQMAQKLNPGGKLILDMYHRGFFEQEEHQRERTLERNNQTVRESKRMAGNRLYTLIEYESGKETDKFEWQLYYPEEICALAEQVGLSCLLHCADFNEMMPASADTPRMQLVFKKGAP